MYEIEPGAADALGNSVNFNGKLIWPSTGKTPADTSFMTPAEWAKQQRDELVRQQHRAKRAALEVACEKFWRGDTPKQIAYSGLEFKDGMYRHVSVDVSGQRTYDE